MTYTLHKAVGERGFPVDVPENTVGLTPTGHAKRESRNADSASCRLDGIVLPDKLRLVNGTALVRWNDTAEIDTTRAAVEENGRAVMTGDIFEIDVEPDGEVTKIVARVPYDDQHDLAVVVNPNDGTLITVWANERFDTHDALNEAKYDTPSEIPV